MYRRGYAVGADAQGEVGVVQGERFGVGELEDADMEMEREAGAEEEAQAVEAAVARAETPPAHARIFVDVPEDNPWA